MFSLKQGAESISEATSVPAVTESKYSKVAVVEEDTSVKQESTDPVSASEEESVLRGADPLPTAATEEQAVSESGEFKAVEVGTKADTLVSVEEITRMPDEEAEMVQLSPVEDVRSCVKKDVQELSSETEAPPAVCASETETTLTTQEAPNEALAAEDVLVSAGLTVDNEVTSEPIAPGEMIIHQDLEKDRIASEVPGSMGGAAETEETPVTCELVAETAPSHTAVEELISFETADVPALDAAVQILPELTLDPLLDLLEDAVPVLKPVPAQEREQEKQTGELPVKPPVIHKAEPEVLALTVAHAEGHAAEEEEEGPERPEVLPEDLEANDEVNKGL